jgi:hypothetical protein
MVGNAPALASAICVPATSIRAASTLISKFPAIALATSVSRYGSWKPFHQSGSMVAVADTAVPF